VQVSVLQESRKHRFLVLPAGGDEELSEEELANVSGGGDCGCHCGG
jgi:bacteriocin-like protein